MQQGQARRKAVAIPYIGIDEKQFCSGYRYISSMVDLPEDRTIDVVKDRTEKACNRLIEQALSKKQQKQVTVVALEM